MTILDYIEYIAYYVGFITIFSYPFYAPTQGLPIGKYFQPKSKLVYAAKICFWATFLFAFSSITWWVNILMGLGALALSAIFTITLRSWAQIGSIVLVIIAFLIRLCVVNKDLIE